MRAASTQTIAANESRRAWLQSWPFLLGVVILSAVPLVWPHTPPLVDLPGHMGRYRVELDQGTSSELSKYFSFKWALIGNLGVDLLIIPFAKIFGLEAGTKAIVLLIPPLTVAGLLWTAREIHGHVPATTLFAVPLVYGFPFNFGFVNFTLSLALSLIAFALWLYLGRMRRTRMRAGLFVPISCAIWITHAFGWAILGLLIWSSELVRVRDTGKGWTKAGLSAALSCIPLAVPIIPMVAWRSGTVGARTAGFLEPGTKLFYIVGALRDRWLLLDAFSLAAIFVLIGSAIFDRHLRFSRRLAIPASCLAIVFLLLPREMYGSSMTDARLVPLILMLTIAAIRLRTELPEKATNRIALLGAAFISLRLVSNTASFAMADSEFRSQLRALDYIPDGARVLALEGNSCGSDWAMPRHSQLGGFVIFRKRGFTNEQWEIPGAQLLRVNYQPAEPFRVDPSEVTYPQKCLFGAQGLVGKTDPFWRTADQALNEFPRDAFDFVWLIKPEGFTPRIRPGLHLIWSGSNNLLYKVTPTPEQTTR
jgi:hypothetical protein